MLHGRGVWDTKQALYYEMRHDGIRRLNKPFPRAADFHLPTVDLAIRKQKPFWFGQCFQNDRAATFVAKREQAKYLTTAAAEWYDYTVRNESNLLDAFMTVVDAMLLRGRGVLKAWVDPMNNNRLTFEAVEPQFIIMADGANDFADADWFVQVKQYTEGQYARDPRFNRVPWETIRGGDGAQAGLTRYYLDKVVREGLTHTNNQNKAIVWELWHQVQRDVWRVHFLSPNDPTRPLRDSFRLPYKGLDGKCSLPFFSFQCEVKDLGWYAPRGLGELLAAMEMLGCKVVNDWLDRLSFTTKPLFTAEGTLPNAVNMKFAPGEILPGNIKAVDMGAANLELPAMVDFVRQTAEQLALMPDFGVKGEDGKDNRTATEIQRISQVMDVGTSFNGEIVRRAMAKVHRHCWALLLQYRPKELSYLLGEEAKVMPEEALHDAYAIDVGGRADAWNQQQTFQRAGARYQLLAADPNVSHEELVRALLTADDPQAARTLFVPTNEKAANEAEDEAQEIGILRDGFPAIVRPNEDHQTRIHVLLSWLQKQQATGAPLDPLAQQRVQEHLAVHVQMLQQQNPEAAKAFTQQVMGMEAGGQMPAGAVPEGGLSPQQQDGMAVNMAGNQQPGGMA